MADAEERFEKWLAARGQRTRFSGTLSDEQIAFAAHQCYMNARRLLDDARLLAGASPARSLSLTVLALEEFAKIPLLFQRRPDEPPERWAKFWKDEFSKHTIKQEESGVYGRLLGSLGKDTYAWQLSSDVVRTLDQLKQQGFYVGMNGERAESPEEFGAEAVDVVDFLFAVAEERVDSFAQFHHSPERSYWFLSEVRKAARGGWPPPAFSAADYEAVVLSLASRFSLGQPPDYIEFSSACEILGRSVPIATQRSGFDALMGTLRERVEVGDLPRAAARAYQMLKLLNSYQERLGAGDGRSLH